MKKITSKFPKLAVLLVEDYFINQEVTKDILEWMECEVDIAEEGYHAVEMAQKNQYDLILVDLQIPGIDGYEVTRRIRKSEKNGSHVPIVALTASALDGDREKCLASGMDDYISKPMEGYRLEEVLRKFFAERMIVTK
jgi:CheY-like chemotaxis protein